MVLGTNTFYVLVKLFPDTFDTNIKPLYTILIVLLYFLPYTPKQEGRNTHVPHVQWTR